VDFSPVYVTTTADIIQKHVHKTHTSTKCIIYAGVHDNCTTI